MVLKIVIKKQRSLKLSQIVFALGLFIYPALQAISADQFFYIVKKKENLSKILHQLNIKPLYGKSGTVLSILKDNPKLSIRSSKAFLIYPNEKIMLRASHQESILEVADILESGQIIYPKISVPLENVISPIPTSIEAEPSREIAAHPKTDNSYSEISLKLSQSFMRIDGKADDNSKATLASGMSPAFDLMWSPHLSDEFWIDLGMRYQKVSLTDANEKTIESKNQNVGKLFLGANYKITPSFRFEFQVGQTEQLLHRATSATSLKVEKVGVTFSQIGFRYDFIEARKIKFAFRGAYRTHLPFKNDYYHSGFGSGFLSAFLMEHKLGNLTIFGDAFYSQDKLPVKTIDFTISEIGLGFGVRFNFGGEG